MAIGYLVKNRLTGRLVDGQTFMWPIYVGQNCGPFTRISIFQRSSCSGRIDCAFAFALEFFQGVQEEGGGGGKDERRSVCPPVESE